ncbi:hypothetical protein [Photorhabdus bodei]|uniref:Uncharacterized protein n=1 Tax=Photorhabdus bodei TaxID=2029681 RepID=A0A329X404_9GAMM|nr:hypothetical protein [Photorhabdus bodei]NDK98232.1 hypothetical protein [Photorhabdus bodei]NDL02482.1 hypothetical protein [Photorhabdus bodei]NDL06556.1 hypothetical protein [Photorhabdus bodei]RAX10372.1 hypothetical protein CKY02_15555 [Photorhabdus bodei]
MKKHSQPLKENRYLLKALSQRLFTIAPQLPGYNKIIGYQSAEKTRETVLLYYSNGKDLPV